MSPSHRGWPVPCTSTKTRPIEQETRRTNWMNILPGTMRLGAGQSAKGLEDQRLLTGKGLFIDDKPEDGALWLHVLRSPHAHAQIVSFENKAAAGMAGGEDEL